MSEAAFLIFKWFSVAMGVVFVVGLLRCCISFESDNGTDADGP